MLILKKSLVSASIRPAITHGTGSTAAAALERFPVADTAIGSESIQKGRMLLIPCLVAKRSGYIPIGVSAGISILTRSLVASFVLFASVGKEIFAGMPSASATGSSRFVPVNASSTLAPACAPNGWGRLIVGACGFGGMIEGGGAWPRIGARIAAKANNV